MMTSSDERERTVPGMAEAIEARREELDLGVLELAELSGLSHPKLNALRKAGVVGPRGLGINTMKGLARALGWKDNWFELIEAGADPGDLVADDAANMRLAQRASQVSPDTQRAILLLIEADEAQRRQND